MPDMMDNSIFSQLAEIATCLCAKITENELPPVCYCGIIAGAVPYDAQGIGDGCYDEDGNEFDDAEGCGQAWVRLVAAYPSTAVGVADITPGNCQKGFGFDIEVGITRCFPIEEKGGSLPMEEMLAVSQLQIADMLTMQQALMCCTAFGSEDFVMGQYAPVGPEGGIVGGTWLVSITVV